MPGTALFENTVLDLPLGSALPEGTDESGQPLRRLTYERIKKGSYNVWLRFQDDANAYRGLPLIGINGDRRAIHKFLDTEKYPVKDNNYYWIPLGIGDSVKKGEKVDKSKTKLTPVFPVSFWESDSDKLVHLRTGYIYIFIDGFLWREIYAVEPWAGKMHNNANLDPRTALSWWSYYDVNLAAQQCKDNRPCITEDKQKAVIALPETINGKAPEIHMCFSEHQWSWEYICKLGGLDKKDPRYIEELHKTLKYDQYKADKSLLEKRAQKIDLSKADGSGKLRETYLMPVSRAHDENNENIDKRLETPRLAQLLTAVNKTESENEYKDSECPVVVLLDPIGLARTINIDFHRKVEDVSSWIKSEENTKVVIARYCDQLVKSDEDNADFLKRIGGQTPSEFIKDYDEELGKREQKAEKVIEKLIAHLEKSGAGTIFQAFQDFELSEGYDRPEKRKSGGQALAVWSDIITNISHSEQGRAYLEHELNSDKSITNNCLSIILNKDMLSIIDNQIKKQDEDILKQKTQEEFESRIQYYTVSNLKDHEKMIQDTLKITSEAYAALENILNILALPFTKLNKEVKWNNLRGAISHLYGIPVIEKELDHGLWKKMSSSKASVNMHYPSSVPVIKQSSTGQIKVKTIFIGPSAAVSQQTIEYMNRVPVKIITAVQIISLGLAWKDLLNKGINNTADFYGASNTVLQTIQKGIELSQFAAKVNGYVVIGETLGKAAGLLGIAANISGLLADIEKSAVERETGTKFRANIYMSSAVFGGIAAIGGAILLFEAAAASATVPVVGWVLAIIGVIGGIIALILGVYFARTPIEEWLLRCYWGEKAYIEPGESNQQKKNLKYKEFKDNLGKELGEFFNLVFAYDAELKWITRVHNRGVHATLFEQAQVKIDLYNHGNNGRVITELRGIKTAANDSEKDRVDYLISSQKTLLPNIQDVNEDDIKKKRLSWQISGKDIPDDLHALYLTVAYDPFGNNKTLIPTDQGIFISLYKKDANKSNNYEIDEKKNSYVHGSTI